MKYRASSIIPMGVLSASNARTVEAVNDDNIYAFYVCNDGDKLANLSPALPYFDLSSSIRILQAKIEPLYAPGLRAADYPNFFVGGSHVASCTIGLNRSSGGGYNKFISAFFSSFGVWHPVDVVFRPEDSTLDRMAIYPISLAVAYDAYNMKDEYKGQPFSFVLSIEFECSGVLGG